MNQLKIVIIKPLCLEILKIFLFSMGVKNVCTSNSSSIMQKIWCDIYEYNDNDIIVMMSFIHDELFINLVNIFASQQYYKLYHIMN